MTDFPRKIYERWLKSETASSQDPQEQNEFSMDASLEDSEEQAPYKLEPSRADAENFLKRIRQCGW